MGWLDRLRSIDNKTSSGTGESDLPPSRGTNKAARPHPNEYDDELLKTPPPAHILQSQGSLEGMTVAIQYDDPSLTSNIGEGDSARLARVAGSRDESDAGVMMTHDEVDDADSVEMATNTMRPEVSPFQMTTDIILDNGAIVEKRRHQRASVQTVNNINNEDDVDECNAIECNEKGVVTSCAPSFRRSNNNPNRRSAAGWCINRDGQREIMAKCSRNGLLIWAILATILLFINLAVSSGAFKNQNGTDISGITSGGQTSSCTGTGSTVFQPNRPTSTTTSSAPPPAASPTFETYPSYPTTNGNDTTTSGLFCGCPSCVAEVWNKPIGNPAHTCGERILYLTQAYSDRFPTQLHACRQIAFEYPCDCGSCDPARCGLYKEEFIVPSGWTPKDDYTAQSTPVPIADLSGYQMYCYPPEGMRKSYSNVWNNGYYIEVKDSSSLGVCGPGDNVFSTDNVIVDPVTNSLSLQFKNGASSEVRVLLPNNQKYSYGTYRFEIGSIKVTNSAGVIVSNVLPKELILGLFTWDDTENYAIHENYNHEVDIEISRWNCETNSDVQFLVQPPGFPQMHRFFSGASNDNATALSQQNHVYEFTWNPGNIDWYSTAGGGQEFTLKTAEALYMDQIDYVQCMPDIGQQTEVRLNLWNFLGTAQPSSLSAGDVVEVVISNFTFTQSDLEYVEEGGFCSKHCQCSPTASCERGICTTVA